jgi:hypothetical protein
MSLRAPQAWFEGVNAYRQFVEWCRLADKLTEYTVATLPTTAKRGDRAIVTDATAPTWNAALTGGGAVVCQAFFNGSAWRAG